MIASFIFHEIVRTAGKIINICDKNLEREREREREREFVSR